MVMLLVSGMSYAQSTSEIVVETESITTPWGEVLTMVQTTYWANSTYVSTGGGDIEELHNCSWSDGYGGSIECNGGKCEILIGDNGQRACIECLVGNVVQGLPICRGHTLESKED